MQKPKLTKAQVEALKKAVSHYGDTEKLIIHHEGLKRVGAEWTTWPELNDLSVEDLKRAVLYGFETVEEWSPDCLDKYSKKFRDDVLDYLEGDFSFKARLTLLEAHCLNIKMCSRWIHFDSFNTVSSLNMASALGIDYKTRKPLQLNAGGGDVKPIRIRKVKPDYSERIKALQLDLDYWLASLYDAMQRKAEDEIVECKWRCKEIHEELISLSW